MDWKYIAVLTIMLVIVAIPAIFVAWLCITGNSYSRKKAAVKRARQKRELERLAISAPKPLPRERARSITPNGTHAQFPHYDCQRQSSFFSILPPEIRNLIYHEVFTSDGRELHITNSTGRLVNLRCKNDTGFWSDPEEPTAPHCQHWCWGSCHQDNGDYYQYTRSSPNPEAPVEGLLSLCLSCRLA